MADASAILDVSAAIRAKLQAELTVLSIAPGQIVIESIDLLPTPVPVPRLTIFLFNVQEDAFLKNSRNEFVPAGPGVGDVVLPPIALDLDYMVCAWASTTTDEHLLLGDTLRVLHDNAELDAASLGPSWNKDEQVQISLATMSIEDQARIWTTFGFKRFKLSLYYKARVVPIASNRKLRETMVLTRSSSLDRFTPPRPGDLPALVP